MTSLRTLTILAGILALAACDKESPAGSDSTPVVAFTYAGPVSGSYRAEGALRAGSSPLTQTGSGAVFNDGELEVQAVLQRGGGSADWVVFSLPRVTAGTETITELCAPGDGCARLMVAVGLGQAGTAQAAYSCSLESGTIVLSEVGSRRVRGTFSGAGRCIDHEGELLEGFTLSGGSFDAPLL